MRANTFCLAAVLVAGFPGFALADDPAALQRALIGRGLVRRLGAPEMVAAPRPLDDLERVRERVRRLLTEVPSRV